MRSTLSHPFNSCVTRPQVMNGPLSRAAFRLGPICWRSGDVPGIFPLQGRVIPPYTGLGLPHSPWEKPIPGGWRPPRPWGQFRVSRLEKGGPLARPARAGPPCFPPKQNPQLRAMRVSWTNLYPPGVWGGLGRAYPAPSRGALLGPSPHSPSFSHSQLSGGP